MEGGTAIHFDGVMCVMGEDEDRAAVWRFVSPPASPVGSFPLAANWSEHVAAHDGCAYAVHHVGSHLPVDRVIRIRAEVPIVQVHSAHSDGMFLALVGP